MIARKKVWISTYVDTSGGLADFLSDVRDIIDTCKIIVDDDANIVPSDEGLEIYGYRWETDKELAKRSARLVKQREKAAAKKAEQAKKQAALESQPEYADYLQARTIAVQAEKDRQKHLAKLKAKGLDPEPRFHK